jgi:hypothetical protein
MPASSQIAKIYTLVGRIALSWNEVDLLWYLILTCLMEKTPREQVDAIFHIFPTGAAQRGLVMTIAGTLPEKDPLRVRLGKLYAKTNDAAGNRNAAIHALVTEFPNIVVVGTSIQVTGVDVRVSPGSHPNPEKKNRLAGKSAEKELAKTITEIEALIQKLEALRNELAPKIQIRADILADMIQRGFPPPSWVVPMKSDPEGGSQQS